MTTLQQWAEGQTSPNVPVNENFDSLSAAAIFSRRHPVTTGLTWGYYGGLYNGNTISDGTVSLTNGTANYVVVNRSTGVVSTSTSTTNWVSSTYARLYKVTTSGGVVTAVEDHRQNTNGFFLTVGAFTGGTLTSALNEAPAATLASASTVNIGAAAANTINITGTTTITAFDSIADGALRRLIFGGTLTLTHNGTSLILPTGANITTAAGDSALFLSLGSGNWRCVQYQRANGQALAGGGGSSTQGKHAIYVSAAAMTPSASGGCQTLTNIASAANQPDIQTLDFDASTAEYAQFGIVMPKKWNEGTITAKFHWSHASTTTNFGVVWGLQAVAVGDDDAIATAYGTAQTVTDTGGTTNDLYSSAESSAITVAGSPAAEDMVFFRAYRDATNGSDTLAIDARLHGVTVYITTDADTDA